MVELAGESNLPHHLPPAPPEVIPGPSFREIALPFWTGSARRMAWSLTIGVVIVVSANVAVLFAINRWSKGFFDTLDSRQIDAIPRMIFVFLGLLILSALINYCMVRLRMGLQAEWRRWLTGRLIGRWLGDRTYYKLEVASNGVDVPEARMSDDLKQALTPVVDLSVGLFNALLATVTFIGVLALVGGEVRIPRGEGMWTIPYGFVASAIVYALVMSFLTWVIGRPLIAAVEEQNAAEADLRFEMTRVRESAESIALIKGEDEEKRRLTLSLSRLASAIWTIGANHGRITILTNMSAIMLPVIPLLIGAPKYIQGSMSLGELMQVSAAFVQVQMAFNWVMDNFIVLAGWRAAANRLSVLIGGMDELERTIHGPDGSLIELRENDGQELRLVGLNVRRDNGIVVIDEAEGVISRGERVLVGGESGTGKSTLIRAIAGLWPWGSGEIVLPRSWRIMFLPQTPYLPLGSLRGCLSYPNAPASLSDEAAERVLARVGLEHFLPRLDDEDRWSHVLSGGERQRIAFARVLLERPDLVVMDEATSALDDDSQAKVMQAFVEELPEAALISVAHRPGLERYHARRLDLKRLEGGVRLVKRDRIGRRLDNIVSRLVSTYGRIQRVDAAVKGTGAAPDLRSKLPGTGPAEP
ncbi:ABC transporter ATP-binding protein/permease [Paracoccus ravus]|uniref:ABC transporter ATP-binding protein/permease n=1 Tax=Paracoccus ravus TaxID=2447760 RepID=UPI00106EB26C|nr:ABC transporter ATP-binding protein/permease [Paracoccus ravus]